MVSVWRVTRKKFTDTAFTGEGARLSGGRFNHKGTALIYASEHLSLAVLEVLTTMIGYDDLLDYTAIRASFDDSLVTELEPANLPSDWRSLPAPESTKALGVAWITSRSSLVLRVPSVVLPSEHNYLINPSHPDFRRLQIGPVQALDIDPRLLK